MIMYSQLFAGVNFSDFIPEGKQHMVYCNGKLQLPITVRRSKEHNRAPVNTTLVWEEEIS